LRSKVSLPEDSGVIYQYARMLLCISLLSVEENNERRVELREFTVNELNKLCKSRMDDERKFWMNVKTTIS
jgi:hypothetical protein